MTVFTGNILSENLLTGVLPSTSVLLSVLLFFANVALASILVCGLGLVLERMFRSASLPLRHTILVAAMASTLAVPVILGITLASGRSLYTLHVADLAQPIVATPAMPLSLATQPAAIHDFHAAQSVPPRNAPKLPDAAAASPVTINPLVVAPRAPEGTTPRPPIARDAVPMLGLGLATIWIAGCAVAVCRLISGLLQLRRLRRRLYPVVDVRLCELVETTARQLGLRWTPKLYESECVLSPLSLGFTQPMIVLPSGIASEFDAEQLQGLFLHEVAHIVRRDHQIGLMQRLVTIVFWWNVLARATSARLSAIREQICDDVSTSSRVAVEYAAMLLDLAERVSYSRSLPGTLGATDEIAGEFSQRVRRLLDPERRTILKLDRRSKAAVAVCFMLLLLPGTASLKLQATLADEVPSTETQAKESSTAANVEPASDNSTPITVRGLVLDPNGKPLPGASVRMLRSYLTNKWAKDVPKVSVTSDDKGLFAFDLPQVLSAGYRAGQPWPLSCVMVNADGFAQTHLKIDDEPAAANATIRMTPFSPLTGRIVNLEGQPVAGVNVQLHQVNVTHGGNLEPYLAALRAGKSRKEIDEAILPNFGWGDDEDRKANVAVTDADGRFQLNRVGRHHVAHLRLSGGGIVFRWFQVANAPTEPLPYGDNSHNGDSDVLYGSPFTFAAEPAPPIVGVVRDADTHAPIAGVTIRSQQYEQFNKYGFKILDATTDAEGRYRLEGVRPGSVPDRGQSFVVHSTGDVPYLPSKFKAPVVGEDLGPIAHDIDLHRGIWIEGRVIDASNDEPVAAKLVYLPWYNNPRVDHLPEYQGHGTISLEGVMSAETDDKGHYQLIGIPGRGVVQVASAKKDKFPLGQGFEVIPDLPADAKKFERIGHWNTPRPEYNIAIKEINPADDAERVEVDFRLKSGKSVTIATVDSAGQPIEVTTALGLGTQKTLQSNKDVGATFQVVGLTDEPRTVLLMNEQRRLGAMLEIRMKDDPAPVRTITLLPLAAITGRLLNADGESLPSPRYGRDYIRLFAGPEGRLLNPAATAPDREGRFELLAVPGPLDYRVYAENAKGNLVEKLRVEPGETIDLGAIDGTQKERPPIKRTSAPRP